MQENYDKHLVTTIASGLVKTTLCLCSTALGCMWLSNCALDEDLIISCEESCSGIGSHMESVTSRKCICTAPTNDIWVLP